MKSDGILKNMVITLAVTVVLYLVFFYWVEHRRTTQGPWQITFHSSANGTPSLMISEPALNISRTILFTYEKVALTNFAQTLRFDRTITNLPFGQLIFQDPTFLPGTFTANFFRHEIELLPRVLVIDKKEFPWQTPGDISITETGQIEPIPNTQLR
jgi:hypothetical protein